MSNEQPEWTAIFVHGNDDVQQTAAATFEAACEWASQLEAERGHGPRAGDPLRELKEYFQLDNPDYVQYGMDHHYVTFERNTA